MSTSLPLSRFSKFRRSVEATAAMAFDPKNRSTQDLSGFWFRP